jgi:hypothetical protein
MAERDRTVDDVRELLDACMSSIKSEVRDLGLLIERERLTNPQPVYPTHDGGSNLRPHTIPGWWQVWSGGICIALLKPEDVEPVVAAHALAKAESEAGRSRVTCPVCKRRARLAGER